jgi:hypothetical protein
MAVSYEPMRLIRTSGEGAPLMKHPSENASSTFKEGVPLTLVSGVAQECAFGAAEIVYGVSAEAGHNLTTDGTAEELSIATPPNMPLAKTIPIGAPIKDGTIACYAADGRNEFSIMLANGQVYTAAMLGATFGITKDATSGYWYLDNTDTTGDNEVVVVTGLDSSSPNSATLGARVFVQFISSLRAFS